MGRIGNMKLLSTLTPLVLGAVWLGGITTPQARAASPKPGIQKTQGVTASNMTRAAAHELARWLAPLGDQKQPMAGLKLVNRLRTGNRKRWGLTMDNTAIKRWKPVFKALMSWNPIPLYQKLKAGKYDLRLFAKLKRFTWHVFAAKRKQRAVYGPKHAGANIELRPVPRQYKQKRRPYRLTFSTFSPTLPLRLTQLDAVLKSFLARVTQASLQVSLPKQRRKLFRTLKGAHSRRVADWLTSRFPQTAKVFDKYADVYKILEPIGKGYYRLDLRFRLKGKRSAAARKRARQGSANISFTFLDKPKGKRWLDWSFEQATRQHRIQGILLRDGLVKCNRNWKPQSAPWRPTKMGATWVSHMRGIMKSKQVQVNISHILFRWKVRKTPKGASLAMGMIHRPLFKIKGLGTMRALARLVVPGGVENLAIRFLQGLAHGDQSKGLRWKWDYVEHPSKARVHFQVILPMVPDRVLTSVLGFIPKGNPGKKRKGKKGRKRNPRLSFWKRIHTAVFADLRNAQRVLAMR